MARSLRRRTLIGSQWNPESNLKEPEFYFEKRPPIRPIWVDGNSAEDADGALEDPEPERKLQLI